MFNLEYWTPKVYDLNEKWWRSIKTSEPIERDEGELHMLMTSELAEAMEGERKNLDDDKLPMFKMAGVEMVDFVIRVIDYASRRNIDLHDYYDEVWLHLERELRDAVHPSYAQSAQLWITSIDSPHQANRAGLIWDITLRLANVYTAAPGSYDKSEGFSMLIALARTYCRLFGYPFEEAFRAKFSFNVGRADHQHESRLKDDGKKF